MCMGWCPGDWGACESHSSHKGCFHVFQRHTYNSVLITLTCAVTIFIGYFHVSWVELIAQSCEVTVNVHRTGLNMLIRQPLLGCLFYPVEWPNLSSSKKKKKNGSMFEFPLQLLWPSSSCALEVCTWSQTITVQHPRSGLSRCLPPSWDLVAGSGESTSAIHCLDGCLLAGTSVVLVAPTCYWQCFVSNSKIGGILVFQEKCGIFVLMYICRLKMVTAWCEVLSLKHGEICL